MLAEDLYGTVQGQRFNRATSAGGRGGLEKGVVDGLFSGFDNAEEQRRGGLIGETFDIAGHISFVLAERFDANVGRG